MKKVLFALTLLSAVSFVSCGPSEEEVKKMEEEMLKGMQSVDSLFQKAEQSVDTAATTDTTAH